MCAGVRFPSGTQEKGDSMERNELIDLLYRAAAALETPEDLEENALEYLIDDLIIAAQKLKEE